MVVMVVVLKNHGKLHAHKCMPVVVAVTVSTIICACEMLMQSAAKQIVTAHKCIIVLRESFARYKVKCDCSGRKKFVDE